MRKKVIIILLILCIVIPRKNVNAQENNISFSNYPASNITVIISGTTITFDYFPEDEKFSYVMINLMNDDEEECKSLVSSSQYSINYNLDGIPNGHYFLEIYISPNRFGTYSSYISGMQLEIKGGEVNFIIPEPYADNMSLFRSRRTDTKALNYYLLPTNGMECDNHEILKLANEITDGITMDYEKVKAIHDWVCENIWYDFDALYGSGNLQSTGALDTLHSKRSVCQGYASLTAALLKAVKIPTKVVSGYALGIGTNGQWTKDILQANEINHAWNEAYVGGRWIVLDATWDSYNKYENSEFSSSEEGHSNLYFDTTMEIFSLTHKLISDDSEVEEYYQSQQKLETSILQKVKVSSSLKAIYLSKVKSSTATLTVRMPSDLKKYEVNAIYKSSDKKIATVDRNGKVTAVGVGKATITVTILIGDHKLLRKIVINVYR